MFKKLSTSLLLISLLGIQVDAQTIEEIFGNYYKATGGITLWNQVKTYTLKQSYVSNAASDYNMEIKVSMADLSILKTKTIMKRNFISGMSPNDAFYKVPTGGTNQAAVYQVKDLSEKEKVNMKREIFDLFAPFYDYEAKGYIATYVGLEAMGAQKVHHIELAGNKLKYDLYFNNTSGLLSKQIDNLPTSEQITKEFTAYSTSDFGIKYPSESTYYSNIDKRNVKLSNSMIFNPVFNLNTFQR